MKKILVVGSKNTYRSIIVAEILKKTLALKGKSGYEVKDAGVMAFPGIPADPEAVSQLNAINIIGEFNSHALDKQSVLEADLILTMSEKIKAAITAKFPERQPITHVFKMFFGNDASDFTAGPDAAGVAADLIEKGMERFNSI